MRLTILSSILLIFTGLALVPTTVSANEMTCKSTGKFHRCTLLNAYRRHVSLAEEISNNNKCEKGYTWGTDSEGIWVDRKCKAIFYFSDDSGSHLDYAEPYSRHERRPGSCPTDLGGNECEYFLDGYKAGKDDADMSMSRAYQRHGDAYDSRFEAYFARGYQAGWNDHR